MLRYKTETRPGLVALYDIGPGNGAVQFLQPPSPHGAEQVITFTVSELTWFVRNERPSYGLVA